jgi:hypothetical protein
MPKEKETKYDLKFCPVYPPTLLAIGITVGVGLFLAVLYINWFNENFTWWGIR